MGGYYIREPFGGRSVVGWGCDDVFCGCYCAWGVRYLMILCTLMDFGGGRGRESGGRL